MSESAKRAAATSGDIARIRRPEMDDLPGISLRVRAVRYFYGVLGAVRSSDAETSLSGTASTAIRLPRRVV